MKKVLLIDTIHPLFTERLSGAGFEVIDGTLWTREKILNEIHSFFGAEIRSRLLIDKTFIDKASNLKFIARAGAGMESIDSEYAQKKGIACINSPEGNRDAVAEHALGMLLSLMNNIGKADREVRKGKWIREENRGTELGGKTIGLIGYGNTGEAFARRLAGFGMNILVYDKYKKSFSTDLVKEAVLERIFDEADILSLHVPLNSETAFMVNDSFLSRFRKPVFLINTSRGKVLKTSALVKAIQSGKVLGACLDVNEYEDMSFERSAMMDPESAVPEEMQFLLASDKVVLTPHIAGWTHESLKKIAEVLAEKIIRDF